MRRLASMLMIVALVLTMFAPASVAVASYPYLSITLDKTRYTPGDTATATIKIHNYPAGLASVTAEMHYDSTVLADPTAPPDLSASLLGQATYVVTNPRPGQFTVNLSQASGTATMGAEATLFTLQFPVRATAPNNYSHLSFGPVTGLVDDGVLLLDEALQPIEDYGHINGDVKVWMGGTIKGRVILRDRATGYQDYSGTLVTLHGVEGPITTTTNSLGDFTLQNAPEGVKAISFTRPGYLTASVYQVPVARGEVTDISGLGVSLIPGNIVESPSLNPDTIFLEDLAGLARAIGSTATTTGTTSFQTTWNAAADLDGDGSVGGSDLARLAQYWGLSGASGYRHPADGTVFDLPIPVAATTTMTVSASPSSVQYSDQVELRATLTDSAGTPLPYKMIEFDLGGIMHVSATDMNGVATVTKRVEEPVGATSFKALFRGDVLNAARETWGSLNVTAEDAKLVFTGPYEIYSGSNYLGFQVQQAEDGSLTYMGPGSVLAVATPLAGSDLTPLTGTGTWSYDGDGYVMLTLANVPYTLDLSLTTGSSYVATPISVTLRGVSSLALSGPESAPVNSTVTFAATLTPAMANKNISFKLDGTTKTQVLTDGSGRATGTFTLDSTSGWRTVTAEFTGDQHLTPASVSMSLYASAPTSLTLNSTSYSVIEGDPLTISALLTSDGVGVASQPVTFTVFDANTMAVVTSSGSLTTDSWGEVYWAIPSVNLPAATYGVEAKFAGTVEWLGSTSAKVPLYVKQPATSNSIGVKFRIGTDLYTTSVSKGSTLEVVGTYSVVATDTFTFEYAHSSTQTYSLLTSGVGTVNGSAAAYLDTGALPATGTYTFKVTDSTGLTGTATLEVTDPPAAATSLQVLSAGTSVIYTDRYEATVALSSNGTAVSGEPIEFRIYSGLDLLATFMPINTSSSGTATVSFLWTQSGTGTYSVQAFYQGSTAYEPATSTATTVSVGLENATLTYTGSLASDSTGAMFVEVGILQEADGELVGQYPGGIDLKVEIFPAGTTTAVVTMIQPVYTDGYWSSTVSGLTPSSTFDVKVSLEPDVYFTAPSITVYGKTATFLEFVSASASPVYTDRFEATAVLTANQTALSGQPVYFKLNDGSQNPPVFGPVATSSTGSATLSILWVQTGAGNFSVEASYPGDTTYAPVSTAPLGVTVGVEAATLSYTGSLTADTTGNLSLSATLAQEADGELVGSYPSGILVQFDIYQAGTTTLVTGASGTVATDGTVTASVSGLTAGGNYDVMVTLPSNSYFAAASATAYYTGTSGGTSGVTITSLAVYDGMTEVTSLMITSTTTYTLKADFTGTPEAGASAAFYASADGFSWTNLGPGTIYTTYVEGSWNTSTFAPGNYYLKVEIGTASYTTTSTVNLY